MPTVKDENSYVYHGHLDLPFLSQLQGAFLAFAAKVVSCSGDNR